MKAFAIESTSQFTRDSKDSRDENCVDNFAAKLTNRDLCLHDLNITLRIALFNKIPFETFKIYSSQKTELNSIYKELFRCFRKCNAYMVSLIVIVL